MIFEQDQEGALRLHSDLVVVSVTVTDREGQYSHGLSARDFTVLEDGRAQKVESFSSEEAPFAAAILIDMSGSMAYRFGLVRGAAASFVEHIRENDQVAVFGFNNEVRMFQDFSPLHDISDYIWDAEAQDSTRLYDCMNEAVDALAKRSEKRRAILLISDGWDNTSRNASMDSALKKALASGITVFSVDLIEDQMLMGTGRESLSLRRGRQDMLQFAERTGGRYIHSPQGIKLEESFISVVDELRNQYTLTYYPTNEKRDGRWRKLAVRLSRPDLIARHRDGYYAPKN